MGHVPRAGEGKAYFSWRSPVEMCVVAVLGGRLEKRGLQLIEPISRAFRVGEIHEWIFTDEKVRDRKKPVDRIAYFVFAEVIKGGIVLVGDEVLLNGRNVGTIMGYDDTHMPNHQNIIVKSQKRIDGVELGARPGHIITVLDRTALTSGGVEK